jgi:hypothetical protein
MDRRTGKDLALFRTGAGIFGSPVVSGDLVIFGSNDGGVYALHLSSATPVRRAVFLDSAYVRAELGSRSAEIAAYLTHRGYSAIDAKTAGAFVGARIEDKEPSVIVFATDRVPPSLVGASPRTSPLRQYLDAGGKIVWVGTPPLLWEVDSAGKFPGFNAFKWNAPGDLLGIDHRATIFDERIVRSTPEGLRWGFPRQWRASWGIDAAPVTVLGADDWGLAAGWAKSYGGPPGTGFIRVPGDDLLAIFLAAEYRPSGGA